MDMLVFVVIFAYGASLFRAYPVRFDSESAAVALVVALVAAIITAVTFVVSVASSAYLDTDATRGMTLEDGADGPVRRLLLRASRFVHRGLGSIPHDVVVLSGQVTKPCMPPSLAPPARGACVTGPHTCARVPTALSLLYFQPSKHSQHAHGRITPRPHLRLPPHMPCCLH